MLWRVVSIGLNEKAVGYVPWKEHAWTAHTVRVGRYPYATKWACWAPGEVSGKCFVKLDEALRYASEGYADGSLA